MAKTYTRGSIETALKKIDVISAMEEAFIASSSGQMVITPMGKLDFKIPSGNVQITCGHLKKAPYYIVKINSEFQNNAKIDKPIFNGNITLYNKDTGEIVASFMDNGYLSATRTAAAGALAAKYFAPKIVKKIGIFGTGMQARMQLEYLMQVTECREVLAFGRTSANLQKYAADMSAKGFQVETTDNEKKVAEQCNLIITATASQMPVLTADMIQPGTHITAIGATTPQKIELAPLVLKNADIVVVDSLENSKKRGEIYHAVQTGLLKQNTVQELGKIIGNAKKCRQSDEQVTIVDLTGLLVQDLIMAKTIHESNQN
ncbi:ornithine cyclodeaminase family protein [bacterium]|nr:ornithine cyclodeaminase family protein [bacterium]